MCGPLGAILRFRDLASDHRRIYSSRVVPTHTHTHTYIYIYIYTYICVYVYVHIFVYVFMSQNRRSRPTNHVILDERISSITSPTGRIDTRIHSYNHDSRNSHCRFSHYDCEELTIIMTKRIDFLAKLLIIRVIANFLQKRNRIPWLKIIDLIHE